MNTIPNNIWKVITAVGVILAVFLLVVTIKQVKSIGYVGKSDQFINQISINGTGKEVVKPDIATFSFSVAEVGKTVAEAQKKATDKINATLAEVKKTVDEDDIKTTSYSINQKYENGICTPYSCPPAKLVGFEVRQSIEVKVRDLDKAGELFTTIGSQGVEDVNGLAFTVDEIETVRSMARSKAIADARTKAEKIAKDLGVNIIRITAYSDQTAYPYYARSMMAMDAKAEVMNQAAPAPSIPTGQQEIVSDVVVTFEIK
jgi:uncharacterized protein YggE